MPVKLIAETERFTWNHEETQSGLYYRRPSKMKQREIQARHTSKGITDNQKVMDELLEYAIVGWYGVYDAEGREVEFKPEYIKALPDLYAAQFINAMYAIDPQTEQLGNSDAS